MGLSSPKAFAAVAKQKKTNATHHGLRDVSSQGINFRNALRVSRLIAEFLEQLLAQGGDLGIIPGDAHHTLLLHGIGTARKDDMHDAPAHVLHVFGIESPVRRVRRNLQVVGHLDRAFAKRVWRAFVADDEHGDFLRLFPEGDPDIPELHSERSEIWQVWILMSSFRSGLGSIKRNHRKRIVPGVQARLGIWTAQAGLPLMTNVSSVGRTITVN